jgi:hypothetical protein
VLFPIILWIMANDVVMANDLEDLDGAEGGPEPAEGRQLVLVDLGHPTMMPLSWPRLGRRALGRGHAHHRRLEAGVADLVVIGEDGAGRCPFGIQPQQGVGRLSTAVLPPSPDKTSELTNAREHLYPRLAG